MKRMKAVIVKEYIHLLRDSRSLLIVFFMPIFMIFIYGYAISFDLNSVQAAAVDLSQSEQSAAILKAYLHSSTFHLRVLPPSPSPVMAAEKLLQEGKIKQYLLIPQDFTSIPRLQIVIDGSDSNIANTLVQYNQRVLTGLSPRAVGGVSTQVFFNPELKSSYNFVPGLVVILLIMVSALLTSLSITRERESGSLDLLFISPLKSWEIILSKTIPYVVVAFTTEATILLFARFWFGIPFRGSLLVLAFFSLLFIITGLSMGILISTVTTSQRSAMFAALMATMLPSLLLSGFIFPLDSLAPVLRGFSYLVPATYFLKILRGIVLKGAPLSDFWSQGAAMFLFASTLLTMATLRFNAQRGKPL